MTVSCFAANGLQGGGGDLLLKFFRNVHFEALAPHVGLHVGVDKVPEHASDEFAVGKRLLGGAGEDVLQDALERLAQFGNRVTRGELEFRLATALEFLRLGLGVFDDLFGVLLCVFEDFPGLPASLLAKLVRFLLPSLDGFLTDLGNEGFNRFWHLALRIWSACNVRP